MDKKTNNKNIKGVIVTVEKTIFFEYGHSIEEWNSIKTYAEESLSYDLWDFSIDDLINGAIEPEENCLYWLIDGRFYETYLNCN